MGLPVGPEEPLIVPAPAEERPWWWPVPDAPGVEPAVEPQPDPDAVPVEQPA